MHSTQLNEHAGLAPTTAIRLHSPVIVFNLCKAQSDSLRREIAARKGHGMNRECDLFELFSDDTQGWRLSPDANVRCRS